MKGENITRALILIKSEAGAMEFIRKRLENFEKVREAAMLTGPYDVMAIVDADEMKEITETLVENIRNIVGVEETVTNIVIE